MKKLILLTAVLLLIASSCSPRINGATPHRRDRNCGCENLPVKHADSQMASTTASSVDESL